MYQFLYWCFMPALTNTMPGLLKHPTAAYAQRVLKDHTGTGIHPRVVTSLIFTLYENVQYVANILPVLHFQ